jgi:hypothetical protein
LKGAVIARCTEPSTIMSAETRNVPVAKAMNAAAAAQPTAANFQPG